MLLFGIASVNLLWMHFAIRRQERASAPQLEQFRFLPELEPHAEDIRSTGRIAAGGRYDPLSDDIGQR